MKPYIYSLILISCLYQAGALLQISLLDPLSINSPLSIISRVDLDLFYIFSHLGPGLGLLLAVCSLSFPIFFPKMLKNEDCVKSYTGIGKPVLLLFFSIILGALASLYPYLNGVNPWNNILGVDLVGYIDEAERAENIQSIVSLDIGRSRPLFFLIVFVIKGLTKLDSFTIIKFMPLILNPLLVVSEFFFVLEFLNNRWAASWSAFFTVSGFQVTVGMFAYYLTNMAGLVLLFSSLGFLLKAVKEGNKILLILACVFGGSLVFMHPWTFDQYFASLLLVGFTVAVSLCRLKIYLRREAKYLLILLASMSASEAVKFIFFQGSSGVSALTTPASGIIGLGVEWYSLEYCFRILYGGLMSNIFLILLIVLGIFTLERESFQGKTIWTVLFLTSLVFVFVDGSLKSRLVYNIPAGLLAALGYEYTLKLPVIRDMKPLYTNFIVISQLLYLFRSLNISI
ncbi:hypothetical protein KEJ21_01850 [Candidatus Bathyarchaeota archaeon]|nr:hypothetical protein [Candidatus Bathyarchaeota archaeon]